MSEPGGERQDPREPRDVVADALAGQHTVSTIDRDFAAHLALDALSAAGWRLVPVGGAPREKVAEAIEPFMDGSSHPRLRKRLAADAAIAAMRGRPREVS